MSNFLCYRRMGWKREKPPVVVHRAAHVPRDEIVIVDTSDPVPHAVNTHSHSHAHPPPPVHPYHHAPPPPGVHVHHPPQPPQEKHYLSHHHFNHHNREVDEEDLYYTKHPIPKVDPQEHHRAIYHNYE